MIKSIIYILIKKHRIMLYKFNSLMKVLPFKVSKSENKALVYQEDYEYLLYDKFHQHEEIQISYVHEGEGTLLVGDTLTHFKKGEIIVLGSNLPHVFRSDTSKNIKSLILIFFFRKDAFGKDFFELDEFNNLKSFLKTQQMALK